MLALLQEVAEEVINPRFRTLESDQIAEKNPGDLVTVADREAETLITAALRAAYPDALVLGEEAYAADDSLMDRFLAADNAFTVDPDGVRWFRTDDLGHFDDAGLLVIDGRADDVINTGGLKINPGVVEDAMTRHLDDVLDVVVLGLPDPEWGEVVTAWIVGSDQMDVAVVRTFLADRLAPFKQPRIVHCVDTLPRNAIGKVQKHLLGR